MNSAAQSSSVQEALINGGYVPHNMSVAETNAFMDGEIAKYAD